MQIYIRGSFVEFFLFLFKKWGGGGEPTNTLQHLYRTGILKKKEKKKIIKMFQNAIELKTCPPNNANQKIYLSEPKLCVSYNHLIKKLT